MCVQRRLIRSVESTRFAAKQTQQASFFIDRLRLLVSVYCLDPKKICLSLTFGHKHWIAPVCKKHDLAVTQMASFLRASFTVLN